MADKGKTLKFSQTVEAPVEQLYFAFSNKTGLKEWFCKMAELDFRKIKAISLWWEKEFFVSGSLLEANENQSIKFTWQGYGDPHPSEVSIRFEDQGERSTVHIEHSGFGSEPVWEEKIAFVENLWSEGLENLKTVLETGLDSRVYRKPMMGVLIADLITENNKKDKGLAWDHGLLLNGVLKGMGADRIGLKDGDLLVEIDGVPITDYPAVDEALTPHQGGDKIAIVYFRGDERINAQLELSTRPVPKIPATAQGLSEEMGQIYASANAKMDEVFYGVSEAKAEFRPKPKEWTSKEVLAHLINSERDMVNWATTLVQGTESYTHTSNLPARLRSTTITYPLITDLRRELKDSQNEGLNFIAEIPAEFVARKSSYVRMASEFIEDTAYHYNDHIQQIEKNLAAAKDVN